MKYIFNLGQRWNKKTKKNLKIYFACGQFLHDITFQECPCQNNVLINELNLETLCADFNNWDFWMVFWSFIIVSFNTTYRKYHVCIYKDIVLLNSVIFGHYHVSLWQSISYKSLLRHLDHSKQSLTNVDNKRKFIVRMNSKNCLDYSCGSCRDPDWGLR